MKRVIVWFFMVAMIGLQIRAEQKIDFFARGEQDYIRPKVTASTQMVAILAPDVACRSDASYEAALVAKLGFPTVVQVAPTTAPADRWVRIKMEENWHCFVSDRYVVPFDEQEPEQALEAIADYALGRVDIMRHREQLTFDRLNIIYNLFETGWRGVDIETSIRLQLQELQLVKAIASTLKRCRRLRNGDLVDCPPQHIQDWPEHHQDRVVFHQLGATWIVEPDVFWSLHDKYRQTADGG